MAAPETDLARIRRWVQGRNERMGAAADQVRLEVETDPKRVTIVERRAPWSGSAGSAWTRSEIAGLRFTKADGTWTLLWPDRNGRFHAHDEIEPTPRVEVLLAEIDDDPDGIFWG